MILNQSYEPLTTCSARKALVLLFLTKADLIEARKDKLVHTVSQTFPYPSVIKLANYKRIPYRQIEISRKNIFKRDNNCCQYCGTHTTALTIDHVLPKSRGGGDTWENLVTACFRCNNAKGNLTPSEAGMKLLTQPSRPSYVMFLNKTIGSQEETWRQFMYH